MFDRSVKPEPKGKINFSLPKVSEFNLENNLKVFHVNKNNLPLVQVSLIIKAGNIFAPNGKYGIAALTSMLIDEGAGDLTALELSDRIEFLGSIFNISANKEYITLSLLTLTENLEESLKIFALVLKSPSFNNSEFLREIERLKAQVIHSESDPSYLASKEFSQVLYNSTPYQHPTNGTLDTLTNLSNDDVIEFYRNNFTPLNSSIVFVGNIDKSNSKQILNKFFGDWKTDYSQNNFLIDHKAPQKKLILVNKNDAPQSEIRTGHFSTKRNSNDFFAKTILNSILGGQFSSRLNLNLRESKGFTYGVHSSFAFNQIGSTFSISTSVEAKNTYKTLEEILKEIENIREGVTKQEVEFVKSYLCRRFPSLFETYSNVSSNVSLMPLYNLNLDYFDNYLRSIESVSLEELNVISKDIFLPEELITVVVGNSKELEKDLRIFASEFDFEFLIK